MRLSRSLTALEQQLKPHEGFALAPESNSALGVAKSCVFARLSKNVDYLVDNQRISIISQMEEGEQEEIGTGSRSRFPNWSRKNTAEWVNHFPYFTITLCRSHHREVTHLITWAKVDMRHTKNKIERQRRALLAYSVFHWYMSKQQLTAYPQRTKLLGSFGHAFHHYVVHQSVLRKERPDKALK